MAPDAISPAPDARRMLLSLPQAVLLLAPGQKISMANPAAEQFLGQSQRRLLGRSLVDVVALDDERLMQRVYESDAPITARQVDAHVLGQGSRRIDIATTPVMDAPGWMMVTLADSATVEPLGQSMPGDGDGRLRGPEVLAHEIKNPLAGIRGAAQLLARKVEGSDRALTILIADEVDRIAKLIDQMQTLSRRTADPVEPCNLHETIRRASTILSAAGAEDGKARIEEEFDPSLPPVLGSAHGLVQVLINLLSNAREATQATESPRIIVRTRFVSGLQLHATDRGKAVRLPIEVRVSDNGPGIDPSVRDQIFEPFVTSKKTGQGLGLALVRKLVRDMNGRITHDRDEAAGWTHFRLHLPIATTGASLGGASGRSRRKSAQDALNG
ncbi:two-component system sensor histidine kinase NtrB [Novosphingobium sediminicola]|uniref:histidine kinase n=1 Tax=Novosphingobium sediminicola TaxID=563162 RepID=A0A7W6G8R3_9SPHN|nr:ATP-binding protein [Novosphingobium sediminicola]MBB3956277.1 two-component system nitrogen regulation sensor histidine kinase GlnL [Novosphingobium sediminicola]